MMPSAPRRAKYLRAALQGAAVAAVFSLRAVHGAVDHGDVLIGEMNCVACHDAAPGVKARLNSRQAPVLGENGLRITPQWLRAYLLDPQAVKPGTVMPDALQALPPGQKARAAEALTQYLVSQQTPQDLSAGMSPEAVAKGDTLYHSVGCVACHAPQEIVPHGPEDARVRAESGEVASGSSSLAHPEMKTGLVQMAAFLRDPLTIRPSGRMPSLRLSDEDATAIATYLQRAQRSGDTPQNLPGLIYEYYEDKLTELPKFERLRLKEKGIAAKIDLGPRRRDDNFALRFRGNLMVATEGEYTFYTTSDDGSQILIDDKPVVTNNGIHPALEKSGRAVLKRGEHAFTLNYFNAAGQRALGVAWEGPNLPKEEIPPAAFSHSAIRMVPVGTAGFASDPEKIEQGRQLFASLKCAACHALGGTPAATAGIKALAQVDANRLDSCIGQHAAAGLPQYTLNETDRRAVRATLAAQDSLAKPLPPGQQIERTMTALNCYACHHRDQRGGPEGSRREYFTTVGDADMGDEGRLPPGLDGAGAKLRPEALEGILWHGAVARPYMATRMPQFGQTNVQSLVPAFESADDPPSNTTGPELADFANAPAAGHKLAGAGGLACIACHNFNNHPSLGIPAIDMTLMHDRLKPSWFRRYLLDPQALRPGTRMPGFWPEGQAINRDVLGGDTDKQIAALWQFLSKGKNADNPDGLIPAKMELAPGNDAIIYRNFIQGAGPRGIGVGYPEKANLVFDADEMRVDLLWQGAFIDASRHRTGRGSGFEAPLGGNVVSWTPGPPLALLSSPAAPWPDTLGKAAGYQFRGYRLDKRQRPAFLYTFGGVAVEDYPMAARGELEAGFHRVLTFHAGPAAESTLFFRAAVGAKIEDRGNNTYLADGKVLISLPGSQPTVRHSGKRAELLVPIRFQNGDARIEEDLSW